MTVIGLQNGATQSSKRRRWHICRASKLILTDNRKFCISSIHPAETFPLILAIGIVIQGTAFAIIQAQGLSSLSIKGCSTISQVMWPGMYMLHCSIATLNHLAIMIVPYIQLLFGLECTFRSLRALPFQARGKYDVTICCGVIVLMLIATWIPSHIFPEPDVCFASLVWFISSYGKLGLIILATVAGLLVVSAVTIFMRLSTVNMVDEHQRIAASRMVYYLVLGVASLVGKLHSRYVLHSDCSQAFVIPYFVSQITAHGDIKLAMMATVVLNLSGLMSGLLHLFLRSNTTTTSFGPKGGRHWNRDKHQIRLWGPNELAFGTHLDDPVAGPVASKRELESRASSQASLVGSEKGCVISMNSLVSPHFESPAKLGPLASYPHSDEFKAMTPTSAPVAQSPSSTRAHTRKQSYALFPKENSSPTNLKPLQSTRPAESVYDITPPPAIFGPEGSRHVRNSSISSSATVQIGLRLSHAPNSSADSSSHVPLPPTTYGAALLPPPLFNSKTTKPSSSVPLSSFNASSRGTLPLMLDTGFKPEPSLRSPRRPSPLNTKISPVQSPVLGSINKTLPPTPRPVATLARESNTQLSPAVYSPVKKIPENSKQVTKSEWI